MLFSQDPGTIDDTWFEYRLIVRMWINPLRLCHITKLEWVFLSFIDNSGISSGTRSWNKFFDGLPDPESEDPEDMETKISEPPIGPYKVFYRIGFPDKPILYPGSGDASEGDQIDVPETFLGIANLYQSLPSCDDTALNAQN